jgi:hypothetical protein
MNKKYKILFGVVLFIITFLINMNITLAADFKYGATLENMEGANGKYVYTCGDIKVNFTVLDVSTNNTSKEDSTSDGAETSGRLLDESESDELKNDTIEFNKGSSPVTTYIAQAGTKQTNQSIAFQIEDNSSCAVGKIDLKNVGGGIYGKVDQANAKIKFRLQIENPSMKAGNVLIRFNTVYSRGKEGASSGSYGATLSFDIAQKVQDAIDDGSNLEDTYNESSTNVGNHIDEDDATEVYYVPEATSLNNNFASDSQKLTCDNSLEDFINEIWKYFVIFGPILLIIMSVLDFFKALFSSDQDMISKAASNTVKRTLATIILLMLPLLLRTVLGFFGLELCL